MRKAPLPFLAVGIALIAIGASGQRALLYVGVVFLAIAAGLLLRARRR